MKIRFERFIKKDRKIITIKIRISARIKVARVAKIPTKMTIESIFSTK